jgi:hypothetical protein
MPLNSSGQISMGGSTTGQSINLELGKSATAQISLNDADARTLAGVASGQISLSNFYGKSNAIQYLGRWASNVSSTSTTFDISGTDNFGNSFGGLQQDDLVIVATGWVQASGTDGNPGVTSAGWTEVADLYTGGNRTCNFAVAYKVMGATPDSIVTVSSGGTLMITAIHAFRNINTTTPLDATSTTATSTGNILVDGPSITTVTDNAVAITCGMFGSSNMNPFSTYGPPTVNIADSSFGGPNFPTNTIYAGSTHTVHRVTTAGAYNVAAWSLAADSNGTWAAVTLAIRPR